MKSTICLDSGEAGYLKIPPVLGKYGKCSQNRGWDVGNSFSAGTREIARASEVSIGK